MSDLPPRREREREKQLGATINGGKSAVDCAEEDANPFGPRRQKREGEREEEKRRERESDKSA